MRCGVLGSARGLLTRLCYVLHIVFGEFSLEEPTVETDYDRGEYEDVTHVQSC